MAMRLWCRSKVDGSVMDSGERADISGVIGIREMLTIFNIFSILTEINEKLITNFGKSHFMNFLIL